MYLVDAGLLGKVNLPPIPGAAQLPDPLARRRTDVLCHAFIIGLAFALYLVRTLSGARKVANMRLHRNIAFTLLVSIALLPSGCGGGSGGSSGGGSTPSITSVAVACSPGSIFTNQTSTCAPTVSGTGNYSSSVTWSVSPTSIGTVSSAGVLTPAGTGTATITATSTQDATKSGNATVTVTAPSTITSVSVACSPASILTTQTSNCTATVQGTGPYNPAVTWGSTDGTITSSGVFTPTVAGTATITATSTEDNSKSGTTSIVVGSPTTNDEWAWMSGSSTAGAAGDYGTLGVASASNVPSAREEALSWTDSSGNLWLFGGKGFDYSYSMPSGMLNDLWKFNSSAKSWTWVTGSDPQNGIYVWGTYGTEGVASTSNMPTARYGSVSWIDSSGNLWLFGGSGYSGSLNDLWEFNSSAKTWTWVSGNDTVNASGVYGTKGVASASNVPGGRGSAVNWIDSKSNLWLFGGMGIDSTGAECYLNDLWEFNPASKEWTWVSGASSVPHPPTGASGVYGTQGMASVSNVPGARYSAITWTDTSGNLWLFGGGGYDSIGTNGILNDLWEFKPATQTWTWVGGSSTANAKSVYGTLGVASASNVPGGREGSAGWSDSSGNLWLFGGCCVSNNGLFNDLWKFSPAANTWTWMSGSNVVSATGNYQGPPGLYGTLGVASASNVPGGREGSASWIDSSGNLWLFGGSGIDSTGTEGFLNDLWGYQP